MSRRAAMPSQIIRNVNSSTNITTGAYVELTSSIGAEILEAEIYNGNSTSLALAIGPAGSEINILYVFPSMGMLRVPFHLGKNTRLSVIAMTANATTGELLVNLFV